MNSITNIHLFVQTSINGFGEEAIAGSVIAMNFEYFTYYVITAFGQTATTFTSQNYSSRKVKRCSQILWICLGLSILCSMGVIVPIVVLRKFFSGFFSAESPVIESACVRIMCILFFEPICNLYEVPAGVLKGTGHTLSPAISTIVGTCIFRIVWICTIFRLHPSQKILYYAFPLSWVLTIVFITLSFIFLRPFR